MSTPDRFTYLDESRLPYPFFPGCGHRTVLDDLNAALLEMQLKPSEVVIVTDIGCVGLSDRFFETHAMHGLHGRSLTYATGIKLANPELQVIVLIGDGGCGIGGNHLINAARRNIGLTVLVFNNLNYGMTGGEHSVTSLPGAVTATTPYGNLEQPLDICSTLAVNGANFVARTTTFDRNLPDLIARALNHPGLAVIDIWEMCAAYFAPNNRLNRKRLEAAIQDLGFEQGILRSENRPEFSRAYREATHDLLGQPVAQPDLIITSFPHRLQHPLTCWIAGAAGMKIGTTGTLFGRGAILAGLWVNQRDEYPVTVRSGFSLAKLRLSPNREVADLDKPDWVVVLSEEGLAKVKSSIAGMGTESFLFIDKNLPPVDTRARVIPLDLKPAGQKKVWGVAAMADVLRWSQIYPLEAYLQAISSQPAYAQENLQSVERSAHKILTLEHGAIG